MRPRHAIQSFVTPAEIQFPDPATSQAHGCAEFGMTALHIGHRQQIDRGDAELVPSTPASASDRLFVKYAAVSLRSEKGPWLAYSLGYRLAADSLIDRVLSGADPREVAYPALFCYRQYAGDGA